MSKVHSEGSESSGENAEKAAGNSTEDCCNIDGNSTDNSTNGTGNGTNGTNAGNCTPCDDGSHGVVGSDTWYLWRWGGDDYTSWHWRTYHRAPVRAVDEVGGFKESKAIKSHPAYKKMMKRILSRHTWMGPDDDSDHYDQWKRWRALKDDDSGKAEDYKRDGWQGTGFSHHDFDTKYDPYGA